MGRETPVVGVSVRYDKGEKAGIRRSQAGHVRQEQSRVARGIGIERQAEVEQEARIPAFQFNAGAADLPRAPMDANPEWSGRGWYGQQATARPSRRSRARVRVGRKALEALCFTHRAIPLRRVTRDECRALYIHMRDVGIYSRAKSFP